MNQKMFWPAALVAVGFLGLVGLMFWRATENMDHFDVIWAVAGPVVGIVIGAIPGFFFAQNARHDREDARQDQKEANIRAEAFAAAVPETHRGAAMEMLDHLRG
jgi:hypothetical protein